ncbi:MAG: hypothetical protein ABI091_26975 [Ferruginibacter sp.]
MTTQQITKQINASCRSAKSSGQTIEINYSLPYVSINNNNGDEYFFQGEEASNLIEEARNSNLHNYCSVENIILWQSQGW